MASEKPEHVSAGGVSAKASESTSEWYEHLKPRGSCLRLYSLLVKKRELIHELGPRGITVLHKGVEHGCVRLVKFILVNIFDGKGYCTCRVCGPGDSRVTRGQLLREACEDGITAVQMAVVSGSPKMVLLLKWAIDMNEYEVKQKNSSSEGDEVAPSEATRVLIQRVQHWSTGNALLFSEEEWDMEGEDMRRLFEVGNREDCDPSTLTEVDPPDAEEEFMEETFSESVNDTGSNSLVVPADVKDDTIDCVYHTGSEESVMIPRVYDLIERILEDPDCFERDLKEKMQKWKAKCMKDVDFEFVPVAHVFLHFLIASVTRHEGIEKDATRAIFEKIVRACNEHDLEEQGNPTGSGSMVATLFKILDPRGRTILHAAFHINDTCSSIMSYFLFQWMAEMDVNGMSIGLVKACMNSKDGAGRTILHLMCIGGNMNMESLCSCASKKWNENILDMDANLSPLCHEELATLQKWCFPHFKPGHYSLKPIHFAILFNSRTTFSFIYPDYKSIRDSKLEVNAYDILEGTIEIGSHYLWYNDFGPLQAAAFLGRPTIIEEVLKQPKNILSMEEATDGHFGDYYPAIHCAALSGQVEAIQSILKFPIYDPNIQHYEGGTALHLLLKRKNLSDCVKMFQTIALLHVLPNSKSYAPLKDEFSKLHFYFEHEPQMFSANEISCINLLLQAGIDIWTPHCQTGERPRPGPMANDKAREWWYNKVVTEVVTQKTSINNASNATSVIATLVATASFIGPLQPPLGLADDGYLRTSASAVRVYFVSNGLSFYFSIASILMAVLPAIPMPKESNYDELFRSQRCLKTPALLLLVSIMCILTSFTSASIGVVSSEWHDKQLVGAYVGVGGLVCVVVLVVYIIRMLRMVFHKNDRFRRWFAKNMIF